MKTCSTTITAEMRANARAHAGAHAWARARQERAVAEARYWLDMPDENLWGQVTPQSLPRTIHTTLIRGTDRTALCPSCGTGIVPYGNYPWLHDARRRPWKLECPNCHERFPKNDFWAYYRSACDRHGIFQPGQGDPAFLLNEEHPDPHDPLRTYAVDDGYGWYDADGLRWAFAAYYNSWAHWPMLYAALDSLVLAYTLTDDVRYAGKALILLDRVADVYPDMDTYDHIQRLKFEHSDGGTGYGRIEGCIWETRNSCHFSLAYDRVFDALPAVSGAVAFLRGQAERYDLGEKSSAEAIQAHIENDLLLEIVKGVKDMRIRGNEGMHQRAMATAAIALDRQPLTNELLDWIFRAGERELEVTPGRGRNTGGNIPFVISNTMDRDGMGSEGAPGYSCWGLTMLPIAELLEAYPGSSHSLFHGFPKYRQCFITPVRWACLGEATPPIGDSGACGLWGRVGQNLESLLSAFRVYRDPRLAWAIRRLLDGRLDDIPADIYSENPLELRQAVAEMTRGPMPPLQAENLNGFGLAIMQTPQAEAGRALWLYYGRNTGHGHRARLDIGLYAENIDMLPDHGYPEYASGRPADLIWTRNSIAHNVVVVDDLPQEPSYTGHLRLFDDAGGVRVVEAESPGIFAGVSTYRRLTVLIDVSPTEGYALDVFRVRGGQVHRQSWHGPGAAVTAAGLDLVPQDGGTFAGQEVPFAQVPETWRADPGYMFLYDVRRDCKPPPLFSLDYRAEDRRERIRPGCEPHLRLTCLTSSAEVALARGNPPQNKRGNPPSLGYAILSREGAEGLASVFTTLIEPYDGQPLIAAVRQVPLLSGGTEQLVSAVEVTLANGRVDTIISCEQPLAIELAGGISFTGTFGMISRRGGQVEAATLVGGTRLQAEGVNLRCEHAFVTGTVTAVATDQPADNRVTVALDQEPDGIGPGSLAVFENDGVQDAAYTICNITRRGAEYEIATGDSSLVRGYADPEDFTAGMTFNVVPGNRLRIPTRVCFRESTD